ncbi:hypothetical protein ACFQ60_00295 [Streptomyces zhihengii]
MERRLDEEPVPVLFVKDDGERQSLTTRSQARLRRIRDNRRHGRVRVLARIAGYGMLRGAAGALGASATGWIIWWIQQH